MKWPFFAKRSSAKDERLESYKRLRQAGRALNLELAKQLPKNAAPEFGKKLGLAQGNMLVFNNDDEVAVLYDYCLFHYRRGGKTVIERYQEQTPPEPDSLEGLLLQAMLQSRFSVFRIERILPRQGAVLQDLVYGDTREIIDLSLAQTAMPGMLLLGRLLPLPEFHMSSGSLIPLSDEEYASRIAPIVKKFFPADAATPAKIAPAQEAAYAGLVLRAALRIGAMDNVFYTDIEPAG